MPCTTTARTTHRHLLARRSRWTSCQLCSSSLPRNGPAKSASARSAAFSKPRSYVDDADREDDAAGGMQPRAHGAGVARRRTDAIEELRAGAGRLGQCASATRRSRAIVRRALVPLVCGGLSREDADGTPIFRFVPFFTAAKGPRPGRARIAA